MRNGQLPTKCPECGSCEFQQVIKDTIDHVVCEYDVVCKSCKISVTYWAYGYYDCEIPE